MFFLPSFGNVFIITTSFILKLFLTKLSSQIRSAQYFRGWKSTVKKRTHRRLPIKGWLALKQNITCKTPNQKASTGSFVSVVLLSSATLPPAWEKPAKLSTVIFNRFPFSSVFLVALKSRARALLGSNKSQLLLFSGWACGDKRKAASGAAAGKWAYF